MPLTETRLRALKSKNKPYKVADERGPYVEVTPSGGKLWRFRYRIGKLEKKLSIGNYPDISLKDARQATYEARPVRERVHLATGLLLPVWKRLPGDHVRVTRIVSADGTSIIGRDVVAADIAKVSQTFSLGNPVLPAPGELAAIVLSSGTAQSLQSHEPAPLNEEEAEELSVLEADYDREAAVLEDEDTLDGSTGQVMAGEVATIEPALSGDFATLMDWADRHRRMKVRTNAETPADCRMAIAFGAEGIGLCRTEHMFFEASRISAVRQMILAEDLAGRRKALAKLLPEQRADFAEIFRVMAGRPCTIRLLDPPLHEFLPTGDAKFEELVAQPIARVQSGLPLSRFRSERGYQPGPTRQPPPRRGQAPGKRFCHLYLCRWAADQSSAQRGTQLYRQGVRFDRQCYRTAGIHRRQFWRILCV